MPAWNEAEGIVEFLTELNDSLRVWEPVFIVVDDCSSDDTAAVVRRFAESGVNAVVHVNEVNSGHGPSTLTALRLGLEAEPAAVIAIDGDGQFTGDDVRRVVSVITSGVADVVEGVRTRRNDPLYRRAVTGTTRALVWSRSRSMPQDANTPLRAYEPKVLQRLLGAVPDASLTPNLFISALSRSWGLRVIEVPVISLPRRGSTQQGSTWGKSRQSLPSKRFVRFCTKAMSDWARTPIRGSR